FFVLYEVMRPVRKSSVVTQPLTAEARQGIFRYFPGVQNGNALASTPTVDRLGNPVRPPNATGPLTSFSVFQNTAGQPRDPLRPSVDPTGQIQRIIARMPLPNDYTVGDG